MNKSVCIACRRYGGAYRGLPDKWLCASRVVHLPSAVIPGHSVVKGDFFTIIDKKSTEAPEWCESVLAQVIMEPDEDIEIRAAEKLVFDGNELAEWKAKRFCDDCSK